ncbi:type VII secretion protein EccCa [uncultured Corynebacterium sp.]|uniref:type VII secretion protein EccCa n=1 Tax=uncultured Corynebacterium sp. TaxID=159447 RepID=UPI0025E6A2EC|nr:type VII secretion protein EccCa [uncultured Corynebacterium sp.]
MHSYSQVITVEPVNLAAREPAPPLPTGVLRAEPIPDAARPKPVPLVRIIMPIVMVVAVLGMVALMVAGGGGRQLNPMMLMFPVMMLMSVVMMFAPQGGGNDPDETRRTYLRHLKALRGKARDHGAAQRAHELHRHPEPVQLTSFPTSRRLWERALGDPDVLEVRVGTGPVTLCTPIEVPESGAPEDLDPVCAVSLRQTVHAVGQLPHMPVVIQLQAFRFLGLGGAHARELARAMILQLVCHHGPETVGISALGEGWEWLKWLPHTRDPRSARFHILLVDSITTTGLEDFMNDDSLTTIIDVAALRTTALGMRAEHEGLFLVADEDLRVLTQGGDEPLGQPDAMSEATALTLARRLAPCRRPAGAVARRNTGGDLLGLLGYGDIDKLAAQLWPGRTGSARLNVPVGVDSEGMPVSLDIKESAQGGDGPHGLCIGATGSGKSELLRTLVTSLAATHSPQELNLVLVDFKGGATFLGCETLPHTAAVITNLEDEAILVERMYDAISGEMARRQEVLRRAGNFANVGDYNTAVAQGQAAPAEDGTCEPLPALVIIVDEFSELLGQHPDFAELFVAVGRLGRSLHVHLLLASQRLEEGRLRGLDSHLSYRFGLKTFSAAESRQVLGITDAYELPSRPGMGYLKTGAESPRQMQASYVSGPLARRVRGEDGALRQRVEIFHGWEPERVVEEATVLDTTTTLLDAVVDIARAEATRRGQSARRIWLPPLPAVVELPTVADGGTGDLTVPVGLVDRPYQQRQDPLVVDLAAAGGHLAVCGGPQSGKSTALRTLVAALALGHAPGTDEGQVRIYVVDLGGGQLSTLDRLPHVAGVAGKHEPDTVRRIIDEVTDIVEDATADSGAGAAGGHTFLIIDGWHHVGTAGADFEDLAERITQLAADGPSARVHLAVSTPRWTTMRPAVRDLMGHRLELRLGEPLDSLIDRKAQQKLPALPGRGLTAEGEPMLIARSSNQDLAHIAQTWSAQEPVPALRVLPAHIDLEQLVTECASRAGDSGASCHREAGIVVGVGGRRLELIAWNPATDPHLVCVGAAGAGKSGLLSTIMDGVVRLGMESARLVILDPRRAHLGEVAEEMVAAYAASTSAAAEAVRAAATTLKDRLPGPDITAEHLKARDWWVGPDIYIVVDDLDLVAETALHPLVELLPHARDIGLHVVVARKSGGIGRALFGGFLAGLRDAQPCALVLDADREEGAIFGIKPTPQPPGRGRLVVRGEDRGLVQIAWRAAAGEE